MQHKSSIIILEKGAHVVTDMITIRYFSTFGLEVFSDTADSSGMRLRQQHAMTIGEEVFIYLETIDSRHD